jgi:hypothetical protein
MEAREFVKQDALRIIGQLISQATICMINSNVMDWSLQPESISNQHLDPYGRIWFYCAHDTTNGPIEGRAELFYCNRARSTFLSLTGLMEWVETSDEFDTGLLPFPRIKDIDSVKLGRFFPLEAFYWDDARNDIVALMLFEQTEQETLVA